MILQPVRHLDFFDKSESRKWLTLTIHNTTLIIASINNYEYNGWVGGGGGLGWVMLAQSNGLAYYRKAQSTLHKGNIFWPWFNKMVPQNFPNLTGTDWSTRTSTTSAAASSFTARRHNWSTKLTDSKCSTRKQSFLSQTANCVTSSSRWALRHSA